MHIIGIVRLGAIAGCALERAICNCSIWMSLSGLRKLESCPSAADRGWYYLQMRVMRGCMRAWRTLEVYHKPGSVVQLGILISANRIPCHSTRSFWRLCAVAGGHLNFQTTPRLPVAFDCHKQLAIPGPPREFKIASLMAVGLQGGHSTAHGYIS